MWGGKESSKSERMDLGVVNTELGTETTEVSIRASPNRQLGQALRKSDRQEGLGGKEKGKQEGREVAGKTEVANQKIIFDSLLPHFPFFSSFLHSLLLPHPTLGGGGTVRAVKLDCLLCFPFQ